MSRERAEWILEQAYNMARSGEHTGYQSIERELRGLFYTRARYVLDNEEIHEDLDRMCFEARKGQSDA